MKNGVLPKQRDMGVELVRVLAMLMIIVLHLVGKGGLTSAGSGASRYLSQGLMGLCMCGVNLFALTTGYVCYGAKQRWHKLTSLWLEVFFYSVAGTFATMLLTGTFPGKRAILEAFFPVAGKQYWYFSAYFCLFCFRPFIDTALSHLSRRQFRALLLTGTVLFSLIGIVLTDAFGVSYGYSVLWLIYVYCVGAYLRAYPRDFRRKRWVHIVAFFGFSVAAVAASYLLGAVTRALVGKAMWQNITCQLSSATILAAAVSLFLATAGLKIQTGRKPMLALSAISFDVYLIHVHPLVFPFLEDAMVFAASLPWYEMLFWLFGTAVAIYLVCAAIGWIRCGLFRLLHIPALSLWLTERVRRLFRWILDGKKERSAL